MKKLYAVMLLGACALGSMIHSTPAAAQNAVSLSGVATEPNFAQKGFWLQANNQQTLVMADAASIKYNGQDANIYRMMGTPAVEVTGTMQDGRLIATAVTITSGPKAKLQSSWYTDQAQPPFAPGDLTPRPQATAAVTPGPTVAGTPMPSVARPSTSGGSTPATSHKPKPARKPAAAPVATPMH